MDDNNYSVIGRNIKNLRIRKKMTQEELGAATLTCRSTVSLWERGEKRPSKEDMSRLTEVFGVSVESLTSDNDADNASETTGNNTFLEKMDESAENLERAHKKMTASIDFLFFENQQKAMLDEQLEREKKEIALICIIGITVLLGMLFLYCLHVNRTDKTGQLKEGPLVIEIVDESVDIP